MLTGIFSDSDSEDPSPANSVGPVRGSCIPHCERDVSFISIASLAEPDIELFSQNKRIIYGSDLSEIFERHELQKAVDEEESKSKF